MNNNRGVSALRSAFPLENDKLLRDNYPTEPIPYKNRLQVNRHAASNVMIMEATTPPPGFCSPVASNLCVHSWQLGRSLNPRQVSVVLSNSAPYVGFTFSPHKTLQLLLTIFGKSPGVYTHRNLEPSF